MRREGSVATAKTARLVDVDVRGFRPVEGGGLEALVRYAGADEWYKVRGAPVRKLPANLDRGEHERAQRPPSLASRLRQPSRPATSSRSIFGDGSARRKDSLRVHERSTHRRPDSFLTCRIGPGERNAGVRSQPRASPLPNTS